MTLFQYWMATRLTKHILWGFLLGGLISQIASIKFADRVNSLTLMSSGPWGDSDPTIPEMDTSILDFIVKQVQSIGQMKTVW